MLTKYLHLPLSHSLATKISECEHEGDHECDYWLKSYDFKKLDWTLTEIW